MQTSFHVPGSKPYLMGASPSEVDASLFGLLAQARWQMPNSLPEKLLKSKENCVWTEEDWLLYFSLNFSFIVRKASCD